MLRIFTGSRRPVLGNLGFNILCQGKPETKALKIYCNPYFTYNYLSRDMRFPTMWYVQPATAQTSLRKRKDCSEPLLVALIFYDC